MHSISSSKQMPNVPTLVDTGAFNTMVDFELANEFGSILPLVIPISIGGIRANSRGCVIHKMTIGDFTMTQAFALAYPFTDWLTGYVILGANVLNNWDFTTSRTDNQIRFTERIPPDTPNKRYPYRNYFFCGKYIAVQDDALGALTDAP